MADDVENVSVVETEIGMLGEAPVDVAQAEDSLAAQGGEPSLDAQVFSPDPGVETAQREREKQVAEENGAALGKGGGDDGRIVTAAGRERREEAKENKREEADRYREAESARRDAWLNKPDHDFGGIRMSGHDLARMIDFIGDPEKQKELRSRLTGKYPKDKEKIDKGMKELNEYIELKKKEQDGKKLTEEEQHRLRQIQSSQEFRVVAQEAVNYVDKKGLDATVKHNQDMADKIRNLQGVSNGTVTAIREKIQEEEASQNRVSYVAASARDDLPKTVGLTSVYNYSSAIRTSENQRENWREREKEMEGVTTIAKVQASAQAFM